MNRSHSREYTFCYRSILLYAFIVLLALLLFSPIVRARSSKQLYTYYCSYEIQPGDTLWSIADKYVIEEGQNKEEFISHVKTINHMLDDDLNTGDYIVISYDSYEVK